MLISSEKDFFNLINKKKIALLVFNKDSRSLLKLHTSGIVATTFQIEYLVDFTLDFRKNIKAMAESVFPAEKIITRYDDFEKIITGKKIDMLVYFGRQLDWVFKEISCFEDCARELKNDFQAYNKVSITAEYNFKWRHQVIDFILNQAMQRGIYVVNAYADTLDWLTPANTNDYFVNFSKEQFQPLGSFENNFSEAKVRFILGTDWACGKTSFLVNRMCEGYSGIAFDFWFSLASNTFIPMMSLNDSYIGKGLIAKEIYNAWRKNPAKEIFVRLGGRVEEFVYGFPTDRRMFLGNLHLFFNNVKFIIVCKPSESLADIGKLISDFKNCYQANNAVEIYKLHYDGREERLSNETEENVRVTSIGKNRVSAAKPKLTKGKR
jgi:hypothetical protein